MLYRTKNKEIGKTLYRSRPLLTNPKEAYAPPAPGRIWFATTTSVWRIDEIIKRRVRDWRRLMGETGHTGERTGTMRKDHDTVYTGTHSVFAAPLVEWILLRYAGPPGGRVLDAFAGGPPRAVVASIMGYRYVGYEIRQVQIKENKKLLKELGLEAEYILADGRFLHSNIGQFDFALTCPPYYDLEKYSDQPDDLSNLSSYWEFNASMWFTAQSHAAVMKPGSYVCIVVGLFRDKKTSELVDFRAHTVENFRD